MYTPGSNVKKLWIMPHTAYYYPEDKQLTFRKWFIWHGMSSLRGTNWNFVLDEVRGSTADVKSATRLETVYAVLISAFSFLRAHSQNFRKATVAFVMSVCPPALNNSGSLWTDFNEILTFEYFSKICREHSSFVKIWQQ
jgi:hypothetical protein